MKEEREFVDLIVVGAGMVKEGQRKFPMADDHQALAGCVQQRRSSNWLAIPNLVVLEARATLGGVWAEENLHEGLKTNNLYGTYEYSDFPMDPKIYNVREGWHIPGAAMYHYLTDYATHFDIFKKIHFLTQVTDIKKLGDGWELRTTRTSDRSSRIYRGRKLIMCNGLASKPNPVNLSGTPDFDRPVFNHGELREKGEALANDPNITTVTVVGASKIGYDAVYMFAKHGKKVD